MGISVQLELYIDDMVDGGDPGNMSFKLVYVTGCNAIISIPEIWLKESSKSSKPLCRRKLEWVCVCFVLGLGPFVVVVDSIGRECFYLLGRKLNLGKLFSQYGDWVSYIHTNTKSDRILCDA